MRSAAPHFVALPKEFDISPEEFARFRDLVEGQGPRQLRRHLDYGTRVRSGQGLSQLFQWIGKILLDDDQVYALEDKSMAFEIAVGERMAAQWPELQAAVPEDLVVGGKVDKTLIYRQILCRANPLERRAAFAALLASRYRRHWAWIRERAAAGGDGGSQADSGSDQLFDEFLKELDEVAPLAAGSDGPGGPPQQELERAREELEKRESEVSELARDLDIAEDRASRAHRRLLELEKIEQQLSKQLRQERDNGEKLRAERSRRIKFERQATETEKTLERLQHEYVRLNGRLQQMGQRLATAEGRAQAPAGDLSGVRHLEADQILGVQGPLSAGEIGELRRRFAAVFHSDRVQHLPAWVARLCDEVLSAVNQACDRLRK